MMLMNVTAVVRFLCGQRALFGGDGVAPDARLDDKLDVMSVGDLSALKIMTSTPRVYRFPSLDVGGESYLGPQDPVTRRGNE
jgi:hypothetical protein